MFFVNLCRRLYWTDWGFSPKIEEAYLDGSNRTILIQKGLTSPNGLTIDYENEILFWCDARLDRIESFNLRNSSRKIIAEKSDVGHPFGITYFNGFVFWTDWLEQAIKRANVHSGEIQNIREGLSSLMGIEMFDKSRQQGKENLFCITMQFSIEVLKIYFASLYYIAMRYFHTLGNIRVVIFLRSHHSI